MNYINIYKCTCADGPGCRVSLYTAGCNFHCEGCHNPESWDFNAGQEFTCETINELLSLCEHDYISGLSILGGEPLTPGKDNYASLAALVERFKHKYPEKTIWVWSGYTLDQLLGLYLENKSQNYFLKVILDNIDVLVEGPFKIAERDITSANPWRGSRNQRVVDVKQSLATCQKVYVKEIANND